LRFRFESFRSDSIAVRSFDCGNQDLNIFLNSEEVENYEKELFGKTTLVYYDGNLVAYYTISNGSLRTEYLRTWRSSRKLGEYHVNAIPCMIIGRLAVDKKWQNRGIGRTVMQRITIHALESSKYAGIRLLVVQAKNQATDFYKKLGFDFVSETSDEKKRFKTKNTRTMFFDLQELGYLRTI
jgi:GNAT superfamily N-acetyltransferase